MKITKVHLISFSPTGNSKKVSKAIASAFTEIRLEDIDITLPGKHQALQFQPDELVIFAAPVYAGRIASLAVERIRDIRGNSTPAVVVVTYGNREYEDALIELQDMVEQAGFSPVATASFIGEHSYSTEERPIAAGRPDEADLTAATTFGRQIRDKLASAEDPKDARLRQRVPGNHPYQEGMGSLPFAPTFLASQCNQCEACLPVCPSGAITLHETIAVDHDLCILCCACVKICPEGALVMDAEPLVEKRQWLHQNCSGRKEPEVYL